MAPKYLGLDTNSTGSSFISSSRLNAVRQDSLVCNFMRFVYTLCFGIISVDACHVHLSGRKTHKKVQQNAFLMRQNKTECRFSRESSSGSHEHYKIKQITYLLPVGFFQLRVRLSVCLSTCLRVCVSRHVAHISLCIDLRFHIQPHSHTGQVFACFLTKACPNEGSYAKSNSADTSILPVSRPR